MPNVTVAFVRGPYGEIFPPPLLVGVDPDQALAELERASEELGSPIVNMPGRGRSRDGMYNLALLRAHQLRLRAAIAGHMMDDPDARDLHEAVAVQGEPMSLRPMGLEDLSFAGFAPVLQRIEGDRWRVGVEGHSKTAGIVASLPEVVAKAQSVYVAWSDDDDVQWEGRIGRALKRMPHLLFHDLWAAQFQRDGVWDRGGGFRLQALRGHGTCRLETPAGVRILNASRLRAVHVCDALAMRAGVPFPVPQPGDVIAWLEREGIPPVDRSTTPWQAGPVQFAWRSSGGRASALFSLGEERYVLLAGRRELTLHPAGKRGRPHRKKRLGRTSVGDALPRWIAGEEGRVALGMWALWAGKLTRGA